MGVRRFIGRGALRCFDSFNALNGLFLGLCMIRFFGVDLPYITQYICIASI